MTALRTRWITIALVAGVVAAAGAAFALINRNDSGSFDQDMISLTATSGKFIQAYFVDDSGGNLYEAAQACAHALVEDEWESANCYAYDSQEALDYAEPSETFGVAPAHTCWRAYFALSDSGSDASAATNADYASEGCPEV